MAKTNKRAVTKRVSPGEIWSDDETWVVRRGRLVSTPGHPGRVKSLFKAIAEKIPYAALQDVATDLKESGIGVDGVYIAHDSMGCPRYVGRGNVISRLRARKRANELELLYFSFYIVAEKKHEREVETLLIRAAGPLLQLNERKKRIDIEAGRVKDYEPGTVFYERRRKMGRQRITRG